MAHKNNPADKVMSELQNSSAHYHECVSDIPFYALRVDEWMNRLPVIPGVSRSALEVYS